MYNKEELINEIYTIREQIGHEKVDINITEVHFSEKENEMWIITQDRPDKSAIIGKGGWVVGKLREKLKINNIHVESYEDYIIKEYKLSLSKKVVENFNKDISGINNLEKLIEERLKNLYSFNFNDFFRENNFKESETTEAVVALSGGVDSSFSLILAKKLGFNPIAITVDPGTIILPNQFKKNINSLAKKLGVEHEYLPLDATDLIRESLEGKFHPCGRCSKEIENKVYQYADKNNIGLVIYGDMLSTGTQCITRQKNELYRLNLPASLSIKKQEIKTLTREFNLKEFKEFGCPLLYEIHRKYPHLKKYSIQRILRETRTSALEPGEALDLIWSFYRI